MKFRELIELANSGELTELLTPLIRRQIPVGRARIRVELVEAAPVLIQSPKPQAALFVTLRTYYSSAESGNIARWVHDSKHYVLYGEHGLTLLNEKSRSNKRRMRKTSMTTGELIAYFDREENEP